MRMIMNLEEEKIAIPVGTTLDRFIKQQQTAFPHAYGELSQLLRDIALAGKIVNREINRAGLVDITGGFGRSLRAPLVSLVVSQRLAMLVSKEHYADLVPLTELIDAGQLTPSIDATYTLAEAPVAMRHLEAGTVRGKITISMQ